MAEIVASGMGIATFGIQSSKAIIEFKQLWSSAPKELSQIIKECVRLSTLLASLKTQQAEFAQYITPSLDWNEWTQHCESAALELEETANSLKDCIEKSKIRGTFKTILKKDSIAKQEQNLDRAKTDLLIAQQMFQSAVEYQLLLQSAKTNALLSSAQLTSHADSPVTTSADVDVGTPCKASASLQRANSRQIHKRKKQNEEGIRLRISSSWLRRVWEIHITNASNSLGIQLRMHNTVPLNALVFRYARSGNVNGLQRLFHSDSKQASVHDRDHVLGQTPLHVAINNWQVEAARFLLQQSADIEASSLDNNYFTGESWTCFRTFWQAIVVDEKSYETRLREMLSLLTIEYETDDVQLNLVQDYLDEGYAFRSLPVAFAVATPQIYKLCKQRDISVRLELALRCVSHDPQDFWCLLGQPSMDEDCRAVILRRGPERLMQLVAKKLPLGCVFNCSAEHIQGWRELLREAVQLATQTTSFCVSPIAAYLFQRACWNLRNAHFEVKSIQGIVGRWLRELQLAGQDLIRYGELEHKYFRQSGLPWASFTFECYGIFIWREFINFSFGPQVEDWHFFISWPFDEWAGEFWHMVEVGFRPPMPGSWVEEEDGFGAMLRNAECRFRTLATSRRKRRRYLRWTHMTEKQAEESLGSRWTGVIEDNRSRAGSGMRRRKYILPVWA